MVLDYEFASLLFFFVAKFPISSIVLQRLLCCSGEPSDESRCFY
jgi:hypothetical protein